MSSFPTLKTHLSYLGCISYRNLPRWCRFVPLQTIQIVHIFICLTIFVWSTFEFFLYEADNSGLYIESFIITCSSIISLFAYLMMIRYKGALVKHLNEFDEFMERSEKDICPAKFQFQQNFHYFQFFALFQTVKMNLNATFMAVLKKIARNGPIFFMIMNLL